jgi:lysophospholipase L1-like esterase
MDQNKNQNVLVIGGGGVRGLFSHRVLQRLNVVIDEATPGESVRDHVKLCVGVSVGAIIAAMVALDMLSDTTVDVPQLIKEAFSDTTRLGPLLAPTYKGKGKRKALHKVFKELTMGDVPESIDLCIVCSTTNGRRRLFRSWIEEDKKHSIVDILDASSAVPILFPPVMVGHEVLVDGGVIANMPIQIALLECYDRKYEVENFNFIAIGAPDMYTHVPPTRSMFQEMGAGIWIAQGLFSMLLGVNDTTGEDLVKAIVETGQFLSIRSPVTSATDNVSDVYLQNLVDAGDIYWHKNGHELRTMMLGDT